MMWPFKKKPDESVYKVIKEEEHRTLIEVTTKKFGSHRYWIPNKPLNVYFTKDGLEEND